MIAVKAELVLKVEQDEGAAREADGQADDVDGGECLVPHEIADGDGKVVFEHDQSLSLPSGRQNTGYRRNAGDGG